LNSRKHLKKNNEFDKLEKKKKKKKLNKKKKKIKKIKQKNKKKKQLFNKFYSQILNKTNKKKEDINLSNAKYQLYKHLFWICEIFTMVDNLIHHNIVYKHPNNQFHKPSKRYMLSIDFYLEFHLKH